MVAHWHRLGLARDGGCQTAAGASQAAAVLASASAPSPSLTSSPLALHNQKNEADPGVGAGERGDQA